MNNILFLFREEEDGESSNPRYILICVPVLYLFSRAKCLVHPSRVILSDQDWLKEIPQLVVTHSVIPSLWKIPVVLHWNWWYYTYFQVPWRILMYMQWSCMWKFKSISGIARNCWSVPLCNLWPTLSSLTAINGHKTNHSCVLAIQSAIDYCKS